MLVIDRRISGSSVPRDHVFAESRSILDQLGIPGEIVQTPGHSDDGVSLLLDDGSAFTGDLTDPALSTIEDAGVVARSWRTLRKLGATSVFPGHGPVCSMDSL